MTHRQAVKILLQCAQRELKRLTWDANAFDRLHLAEPMFKKASEARRRITEAIETLASEAAK